MKCKKYSAGLMSQSFWFLEFKKAVKMRQEGMTYDDIKKKCVEENLFGAAKEYRALSMAGYIITRVKAMDDTLVDLFCTSDLATQKLINLVTILRTDRLFFEFVYETYREKVILGVEIMEDKKKMITPPILDIVLERYLQSVGEEVLGKALVMLNDWNWKRYQQSRMILPFGSL